MKATSCGILSSNAGAFSFITGTGTVGGAATLTNVLQITSAGQVGIGTASPAGSDGYTTLWVAKLANGIARVNVGGDSQAASSGSGWAVEAWLDNNVYQDTHTGASGLLYYRCGQGTEVGNVRTWMSVATASGNVSIPTAVSIGGASFWGKFNAAGSSHYIQGVNQLALGLGNTGSGWVYFGAASNVAAPDGVICNNAGTEIIRFTNGGLVGIGTTSPSYMLHCAGTAAIGTSCYANQAGDLGVSRNSAPTSGVVYFGSGGSQYLFYDGGGNWSLMGGSKFIVYSHPTFVDAAGSWSPYMTLGSATGVIASITDSSNTWGLYFGHNSNGNTWIQCGRTDGNGTAYQLSLNAMGGNVGISTASPTNVLTVKSPVNPTTTYTTWNLALAEQSDNAAYRFYLAYTTAYAGGTWCGALQTIAGNAASVLLLNPAGGNVGVNNGGSIPGASLDVFGTIRSQGIQSPASGAGVELNWNGPQYIGSVNCFDRSAGVWRALYVQGLAVCLNPTGQGKVLVNRTGDDGAGCVFQVQGGISNNQVVIASPSDIRLKRDVQPYKVGLDAVLQVKPIKFKYNGKGGTKDGVEWVSLDAQAHKDIIPDAIVPYEDELDGEKTTLWNFGSQPLLFALVNAVKELSERLEKLEHGTDLR